MRNARIPLVNVNVGQNVQLLLVSTGFIPIQTYTGMSFFPCLGSILTKMLAVYNVQHEMSLNFFNP